MYLNNTGLLRILFFLTLYITVPTSYLVEFASLDIKFYCSNTTGIFFNLSFSPFTTKFITHLLHIALITSALGFLTRISYLVSLVTLLFLSLQSLKFCYNNYSILALIIPIFFWLILDTCSGYRLDNVLFKKSCNNTYASGNIILFLQIHFCIIFFLAGIAKLRLGGIDWIFSNSMENILILQNYFYEDSLAYKYFHKLQRILLFNRFVPMSIALSTVIIEIAAPIALFSKKWGPSIILHLFFLQIGIYIFMYIDFFSWTAFYIVYPFYYNKFLT